MVKELIQLVILFFVIFDPPASLIVFLVASSNMDKHERKVTATLAVTVAALLSYLVLLLGQSLLTIFSTNIEEFRIAGGIILGILGIKMALGLPLANLDEAKNSSGRAIASIIGTPLLTGPAAITSIILAVNDYGRIKTGLSICIVLAISAVMLYKADMIHKILGKTSIQVSSTVLGLITLAWGVKLVSHGLLAIFS
ncbi:MarC family protein [Candidatus Woesearchaeota archaeon]|nr:MarC family protein [Candidatus Woesearchaeota archaeon]